VLPVSADDIEVARAFLAALATVANTGERQLLYPFLAADIEWITPRRDLDGIDEVRGAHLDHGARELQPGVRCEADERSRRGTHRH
jgi:hypothetical protein